MFVGPESIRIRVRIPLCDNQIIVLNLFLFVRNFIYAQYLFFCKFYRLSEKHKDENRGGKKHGEDPADLGPHTHQRYRVCSVVTKVPCVVTTHEGMAPL